MATVVRPHRAASTRRWPGRCAGPPPGTWSATPSWPPATTWRWSAPALPRGARHQPGHRHAAAGPAGARPVRRPGLGADRLGSCWPTPPGTRWPRRAGQRLPARLGPRVHRRPPARRRTWPRCAAGWTAPDVPAGPRPSTPSCAGRCCRRWSPTARPSPSEIEAELDRGPHRQRRAGGRAGARADPDRRSRRPRCGADSPATRQLPNWLQRALLQGFQHPAQVELTAPYVPTVLRRGRRGLGDPRQRAGAGVRRAAPTRRYQVSARTPSRRPTPGWPARATRRRCAGWSPRATTASSAPSRPAPRTPPPPESRRRLARRSASTRRDRRSRARPVA